MSAFAAEIPSLLLRTPNAVQSIVSVTRRTARTAFNWINGDSEPRASELLALMKEFPEIADEVDRITGRQRLTPEQIERAKEALKLLGG